MLQMLLLSAAANENFLSVAIIGSIFAGFIGLLKVLYGGNQSKSQDYAHQEKIIELITKQTDNSEKLLAAIDKMREELNGINERVLRLEEQGRVFDKSDKL